MLLIMGRPQECLERVCFAGRPPVANALLDMSHSHKCDKLKTRFHQSSLVTAVQSFGMDWTMVAGAHRQQLC